MQAATKVRTEDVGTASRDIARLINGACFYASGGGGSIVIARQMAQGLSSLPPRIATQDVPDAALTAIIADIGSPDAMMQGAGQTAPVNAFDDLAAYFKKAYGSDLPYVVPVEMGAVSTLIPFLVASLRPGITVVDGDPCGRAVPELSMTLYAMANLPVAPVTLSSDTDDKSGQGRHSACLFWAEDVHDAEECARTAIGLPVFNQIAGLGCYAVPGRALRAASPKAIIGGTVSRAIATGDLLERYKDPVSFQYQLGWLLQDKTYLLVSGTITEKKEVSGGFDVGQVRITADDGARWVVSYMNENLYIQNATEGKTHGMGPDLICYRTEDGRPFSNADIDTKEVPIGTRVTVFGVKCDEALRCDAMVAEFGAVIDTMFKKFEIPRPDPRYVPIERLNG